MTRGERFFSRFFDEVEAAPALRSFVLDELPRPTRHWHGLLHHALMLRAITRADHPPAIRRRLVLATLFHDIVYDATRSDNEEVSALVARAWCPAADAKAVAALILATKRHDLAAADPVTRTLLEADLEVLWTPAGALYRFYAAGIRAEYAHVPKTAYRAGRSAVLRDLVDRLAPTLDGDRLVLLRRNVESELAELA